jgi:hypothetical protein
MRNNKRRRTADRGIERQLSDWQALARHAGRDMAKSRVTDLVLAAMFWMEDTYGTRQAAEFFQTIVDQLVEDENAAA